MACAGTSASHCGLLMIPMMGLFVASFALGVGVRFEFLMPLFPAAMLGLFTVFTVYYYFRGYTACQRCGAVANRSWKVWPHCEAKLASGQSGERMKPEESSGIGG